MNSHADKQALKGSILSVEFMSELIMLGISDILFLIENESYGGKKQISNHHPSN